MNLSELNTSFFRVINDLGKQYTFLNPVIEFIAQYTIYFLALSVIIFLFTRNNRNRLMIISALIALIAAEIVGKVAGLFHSNNQPFVELSNVNQLIEKSVGNSFPSDHTIIFFSICVTYLLFRKKNSLLWVILAFIVAFSRVWVGVHYPADVIIGAIIGAASAISVYQVVPNILQGKLKGKEVKQGA